ncbi:DUF4097 domain-containing protein [Candidatus Dependentiae bacterium]
MCRIILLVFLLFLLLGFINKKVMRYLAVIAILFLITKEAIRLHDRGWPTKGTGCFICDIFKKTSYGGSAINQSELVFSEVKNFTMQASPEDLLHLSCTAGDIKIEAWDKDTISIKAEKKARTKEDLKRIRVTVGKKEYKDKKNCIVVDDRNSFEKQQLQGKEIYGQVYYEIKVPRVLASMVIKIYAGAVKAEKFQVQKLEIQTHAANVKLEHITGDIDMNSFSGDLEAKDIAGNLKVDTKSGSIEAKDVSGDIFVSSASGSIEIEDAKGKRVNVGTLSGDIEMENVKGAIEVDSKSGDIELKKVHAGVKAKTLSGSIEIKRASGAAGEIKAKSLSGSVEIKDFEGNIISQGPSSGSG